MFSVAKCLTTQERELCSKNCSSNIASVCVNINKQKNVLLCARHAGSFQCLSNIKFVSLRRNWDISTLPSTTFKPSASAPKLYLAMVPTFLSEQ